MMHCDDYIDDPSAPEPLRRFLDRARQPAHGQLTTDWKPDTRPFPKLFATHDGKRVRVVMASRLGDVGITTQLDRTDGYDTRVAVADLSDFADEP